MGLICPALARGETWRKPLGGGPKAPRSRRSCSICAWKPCTPRAYTAWCWLYGNTRRHKWPGAREARAWGGGEPLRPRAPERRGAGEPAGRPRASPGPNDACGGEAGLRGAKGATEASPPEHRAEPRPGLLGGNGRPGSSPGLGLPDRARETSLRPRSWRWRPRRRTTATRPTSPSSESPRLCTRRGRPVRRWRVLRASAPAAARDSRRRTATTDRRTKPARTGES